MCDVGFQGGGVKFGQLVTIWNSAVPQSCQINYAKFYDYASG